jgi:PhnB protein
MTALTPYLTVSDAAAAIDFYTRAFGAQEVFRLTDTDGRIGHAELRIGDSLMMLADEYPDFGALSPARLGGSPVKMHLDVERADQTVESAVAAGATLVRPVQNELYGSRSGMIVDPFGHSWFLAAKCEEVSVEEMQRRLSAMASSAC